MLASNGSQIGVVAEPVTAKVHHRLCAVADNVHFRVECDQTHAAVRVQLAAVKSGQR